jgi:hypothetical protein
VELSFQHIGVRHSNGLKPPEKANLSAFSSQSSQIRHAPSFGIFRTPERRLPVQSLRGGVMDINPSLDDLSAAEIGKGTRCKNHGMFDLMRLPEMTTTGHRRDEGETHREEPNNLCDTPRKTPGSRFAKPFANFSCTSVALKQTGRGQGCSETICWQSNARRSEIVYNGRTPTSKESLTSGAAAADRQNRKTIVVGIDDDYRCGSHLKKSGGHRVCI